MKVLLLIVLVKFVVSDWEVYKHELYDIASSIDWNSVNSDSSLTPLTLIDPTLCTPTSSMYLAGGKNKIQRSISMPTTRKFSAIQIYLDFYFIDVWKNTTVLFYLNNGIIMQETPYKITSTSAPTTVYCTIPTPVPPPPPYQVDDSIVRFTHTSDFTEAQLNLEILVIGLPVTRIFALQNFYLLIQYCDINCLVCDKQGLCLTCSDGLYPENGQCTCYNLQSHKYSFYSGGYLSCVFPCPNGYLPDMNKVCQLATQDLLFEDLTGTFNSYLFFVEKDKYYSDQNNNDYRIMTIEGSTAAGPISFNENLVYKPLSIQPNSLALIKFKLYFLRTEQSNQVGGQIKLKINGYQILLIIDYDGAYLYNQIGSGTVTEFQQCKYNSYDKCYVSEIEFLFNANYEITEIKFESHFTITEPGRKWAIRDFQIKKISYSNLKVNECENNCLTCEYSKPKNCKSCLIGYYLFDKVCVQNCPPQTTQFGNICKEDNIVENVDYLLNVLYNDGNFEKEIDAIDPYNPKQSMQFSKFQYGTQSYTLLGGFSLWNYQTLQYQITSTQKFYKAYLKFNVVCIDCSTVASQLNLDFTPAIITTKQIGIGASNFILTNIGLKYGLNSKNEYHGQVFLDLQSFASINSLTLKFSRVSLQTYEYLGIYNLRLMVVYCPIFCDTCSAAGICGTWMTDSLLTPGTGSCISGYFYDSQTKQCQQCGSGCSNCNSILECNTCNVGYILHEKVCYCTNSLEIFSVCTISTNCQIGCLVCGESAQQLKLSLIQDTNYLQCIKCDDTLHYWLDIDTCRCLDGYYMDQITCQPCSKYCKSCKQQPKVCTSCNTNLNRILHYQQCECIDGYYEQENTVDCSKCDIVCYTCRFFANYCTSCYPDQFREIINRNCECIDGYYDDGTTICKKCDSKCKACLDADTCISCFPYQNRKLSLYSGKCICKIGYFEVENQLSCDSCHFSCKTCLQSSLNNMCTRCPSSREPSINDTIFQCKCKRGYYESNMNECSDCRNYKNPPSTHYCYSNCGDNQLQWNEECDDGNNIPKDGCYQCLLPGSYCFNELCIKCEMGICIQCIDGYFLNIDNICEICDQSCKTCLTRYDKCTSCVLYNQDKTGCIMCQTDKGYQIKDNQCIPICGDGLRVNQENCDDGNDKNGDGCYECKVEDGWICDTVCERIIYPIVIFDQDKFDNQYDSIRNIIIQTNIELRVTGSINNLCQFSIKNNEIFQIIKNTDITDYNDNFSILKFSLKLQLENVNLNPILICTIKDKTSFISQQGFTFNQTSFEFEMLKYNKQSRSVVQATEGLLSFSKYILYILLGLAIFAFLVGGLDIFFNLLDILQLISYLQFFNIVYPYNVETYFQLFDFAQFDFIKQFVDIEGIINQYVESPQPDYKFAQQGYSSTFYINGVAVFTVFITTIAIFIGCKYGFLFLAKLLQYYSDENDTSLEEEPNVLKFILFRILRGVQKLFLSTLGEFSSGVIRTFMAITYDYNIAVFLQIRSYNSESKILASSYAFSIIFLLLQINFLFEGFKIMGNKSYYFKSFFIKRHYGALYEGINIRNSSPFSNYYNLVLFLKKILFIVFLVNLYNEPCFQIFTCSALNILFIIYIHYNQPLEEKYEYYKTIGSEIFIWIAEILIIILYYGQQQGFDQSQELLVGWFIITFCTLLILFQFVIDVKQHFEFLFREYKILSRLFYRLRSLFRNGQQQPVEETQQQENLVDATNSGKQSKKVSKATLKTKSTTATSLYKQRKLVTFTIKN